MEKIDFKKQFKDYYSPKPAKPEIVSIPDFQFAMIDGQGDPNGPAFQHSTEVLYSVSFTLKFTRKKSGQAPDYGIGPLEGLWWMDGPLDMNRRDDWLWTLMIMQPNFITPSEFTAAIAAARAKHHSPAPNQLRLERFHEGEVVQVMHVGPYATEAADITLMHDFARDHGYQLRGKHHEIYLGDPRRTAPDKLRTILRQPINK